MWSLTSRKEEEREERWRKDIRKIIKREEATSHYWNVPQVKTCHWIDFSENRGWTCMPWLINVLCFLPYLNPRPSHISQEQIEQGTDTGLTIKPKIIRNHWKTSSIKDSRSDTYNITYGSCTETNRTTGYLQTKQRDHRNIVVESRDKAGFTRLEVMNSLCCKCANFDK